MTNNNDLHYLDAHTADKLVELHEQALKHETPIQQTTDPIWLVSDATKASV